MSVERRLRKQRAVARQTRSGPRKHLESRGGYASAVARGRTPTAPRNQEQSFHALSRDYPTVQSLNRTERASRARSPAPLAHAPGLPAKKSSAVRRSPQRPTVLSLLLPVSKARERAGVVRSSIGTCIALLRPACLETETRESADCRDTRRGRNPFFDTRQRRVALPQGSTQGSRIRIQAGYPTTRTKQGERLLVGGPACAENRGPWKDHWEKDHAGNL